MMFMPIGATCSLSNVIRESAVLLSNPSIDVREIQDGVPQGVPDVGSSLC